jgi:hypothetical protein
LIDLKIKHPANKYSIFMILMLLKFLKSTEVKLEQPYKNPLISLTFLILKFVKSIDFNEEQFANTYNLY